MPPRPEASTVDDAMDVAVVGGGPAGSAAAVFTARYGLDTVVFDSGPSSLRRCAYLTNYLGFPAGVDVETFHDLAHAQVREAGATIREQRVDRVDRGDDGRFRIALTDSSTVHAERVIAATRSGGEYLRPLGGDAMFDTHEHDGEVHEHFDPAYPDADGRTPIDGLYVASPSGERDVQAIVAAGQGAHVARRLLADWRNERGYPDGLDEVYDWLRPDAEFSGEWGDREGWRNWFDSRLPEEADLDDPVDRDEADGAESEEAPQTLRDLRETYVDEAMATRRSAAEIDRLTEDGLDRLIDALGPDRVLEAIDDDRIEAYVDGPGNPEQEVTPDG